MTDADLQKDLIDSVTKHLDAVASTLSWSLLLAVVFFAAGITERDTVKAIGLEVSAKDAQFVASLLYCVVSISVLLHFVRIQDVLGRISAENVETVANRISTHTWIANPIAIIGRSTAGQYAVACGQGLLVLQLVFCVVSVTSFNFGEFSFFTGLLLSIFTACSFATIFVAQRIVGTLVDRLTAVESTLSKITIDNDGVRRKLAGTAGILALGLFFVVGYVHEQQAERKANEESNRRARERAAQEGKRIDEEAAADLVPK